VSSRNSPTFFSSDVGEDIARSPEAAEAPIGTLLASTARSDRRKLRVKRRAKDMIDSSWKRREWQLGMPRAAPTFGDEA
jgi:hypothetical protein